MPTNILTNAPVYAHIPASDLERARIFYEELLGLQVLFDAMPGIILFKAGGGSQLMLYQRESETKGAHPVAGFIVLPSF